VIGLVQIAEKKDQVGSRTNLRSRGNCEITIRNAYKKSNFISNKPVRADRKTGLRNRTCLASP
jgi:hypothetical protein